MIQQLFVQSAGQESHQDYQWLSLFNDVPQFLYPETDKHLMLTRRTNKENVFLYYHVSQQLYVMQIANLATENRLDFVGRPISNTLYLTCTDERIVRGLALQTLVDIQEIARLLDQHIVMDGDHATDESKSSYGFSCPHPDQLAKELTEFAAIHIHGDSPQKPGLQIYSLSKTSREKFYTALQYIRFLPDENDDALLFLMLPNISFNRLQAHNPRPHYALYEEPVTRFGSGTHTPPDVPRQTPARRTNQTDKEKSIPEEIAQMNKKIDEYASRIGIETDFESKSRRFWGLPDEQVGSHGEEMPIKNLTLTDKHLVQVEQAGSDILFELKTHRGKSLRRITNRSPIQTLLTACRTGNTRLEGVDFVDLSDIRFHKWDFGFGSARDTRFAGLDNRVYQRLLFLYQALYPDAGDDIADQNDLTARLTEHYRGFPAHTLPDEIKMQHLQPFRVEFRECNLREADFSGVIAAGLSFVNCQMHNARFDHALLLACEFDRVDGLDSIQFPTYIQTNIQPDNPSLEDE